MLFGQSFCKFLHNVGNVYVLGAQGGAGAAAYAVVCAFGLVKAFGPPCEPLVFNTL